jgi:tRNA-Thr(GGU) m(6)t(6)A37 methyltransferase TsaA
VAIEFKIFPIGIIRKTDKAVRIDVEKKYAEAIFGLEDFSHIVVLYWFHKNDTPKDRKILKVHPKANPKNPLTGVFATHSPRRPNLIALSICEITRIEGNSIYIDKIDALDGTPVIDIKCYIPSTRPNTNIRVPDWVA